LLLYLPQGLELTLSCLVSAQAMGYESGMAREGFTPQDYYDLIALAVRDMMIAGKTVRSDAGDRELRRFAFYLRDALDLPQPGRH
jgi:hypothetical protein